MSSKPTLRRYFKAQRHLEEAATRSIQNAVAALIDQFFAEIQAMGGGRLDTSAIIKRLPKKGKK